MQRIRENEWTTNEPERTPESKRSRISLRSVAAAVGIFSGIASLFIGLVCVAVHSLVHTDHVFDQVGSILLICSIPLMLAGSMALDEAKSSLDD